MDILALVIAVLGTVLSICLAFTGNPHIGFITILATLIVASMLFSGRQRQLVKLVEEPEEEETEETAT